MIITKNNIMPEKILKKHLQNPQKTVKQLDWAPSSWLFIIIVACLGVACLGIACLGVACLDVTCLGVACLGVGACRDRACLGFAGILATWFRVIKVVADHGSEFSG